LYSSDTPGSCHLQVQGVSLQRVKRIKLIQFSVANTIYNVVSGVNNYVCWNRGGTSYTYQIPSGQYSIANLLTTIQTGMNNADSNSYALTYSSTTFLVTATGTSAFYFNWLSSGSSAFGCYEQLGFTKVDTSSATSITGTNVVDLTSPQFVFVDINEIPGNIGSTSSLIMSNKFNFVVPLYESNGNLVYVKQEEIALEQRLSVPINLSNLTVQIKDKNGTIVNTNGSNWTMIWELDYEH
jgi:hypothetical protein